MKHKLKKILLLFLFIGTLFVSCELQEDVVHQHEHNSKLKLYEMKFEELMTNKQFVNSFSKLPKRKKSIANVTLGRTVMEDEYGFTIADKPAKVIEDNSSISYTFLIIRDSINANSFENLVIQTDTLNSTKAIIIKYNLTSNIIAAAHGSSSFQATKEVTHIVYNNQTSTTGKELFEDPCTTIHTIICCQSWSGGAGSCHVAQQGCLETNAGTQYLSVSSETVCISTTGGSSTGSSGTDSSGTGSSGGGGGSTTGTGSNYDGSDTSIHGNGSNSVNTAPVAPEIEGELAPEDPCNELKKLGQNSNFSEANYQLKINLPSKETEQGYAAKKNSALTTNIIPYPQNANGMTSIKLRPTGNQYGSTHHHGRKNYQMFSCTDIFGLYQFSQIYESSLDVNYSLDMFFNMLVTFNYDYVIKIDDLTKLSTITEYFQTQEDALRFDERIRGIYQTYGGGDNNADYSKLERVFLDFTNSNYDTLFNIGNHDFGISLYRRDNTMKSTQSNNWVKLELDENGNVIKKPCNN